MELRTYQREAIRTDRTPKGEKDSVMVPLLGLAGEVGSLLTEYKKWLREGERYRPFTDQVSEEIGDVLWYLANLASKLDLDLSDIAEENVAKIQERWPAESEEAGRLFSEFSPRFDSQYPPHEQLPSTLRIEFREILHEGDQKLAMYRHGEMIGDPLTDNAHDDDGYRFHDVFHLANAMLLGWSPVTRSLMKIKRKSVAHIDEVEDGARAAVTEEAISALIFGHAKDFSFYEGATSVEYDLLRTIRIMTQPFEVRQRSIRDWENSILQGYQVWRHIRENCGGVFVGDLDNRQIRYEPLSSKQI